MANKLDRRDFLKVAGLAAASYAMPRRTAESAQRGGGSDRCNIIFIMADDMGYADLGCYGQRLIQTPNIDRMAAEGTRFMQCYAGSTVCAPSRSVLMTGQHTGHTRVRGNFGKTGGVLVLDNGSAQRRIPLEPEDVTVAEVLKKAGYATGITGKWGLGEPNTTGTPNRKGFDEWLGYLNQRRAHRHYAPYLWENEKKLVLEANKNDAQGQHTHELFAEFALSFVRRHKNGPFFLYLGYTLPHAKFEIPDLGAYADKPWPEKAKAYAAMVTRLDSDVGRLMALLKKLDIDKRTIVFFCSDNGASPRPWKNIFYSCGPLRGRKLDLYEGGIRVPMIVRWPGRVPAGRTDETPWCFADVLPTFAELAGVKPPENIDGVSVAGILLGKQQKLGDRFLYWEYQREKLEQAVRWGRYKAIRHSPEESLELYDLEDDVGELYNIAGNHPDIIAKIRAYLQTARTESVNWPTGTSSEAAG